MRFRDVGVQHQYDGDFNIYREEGDSRYGEPDYLFLYFHTECCVVLDGEEVPFYKLNLIKWGLFYKVGNSYIDLETLKVYKLTKTGGFKFLQERSIDPRSLSPLNTDKSHISYRQIKKILKQN